MKLLPSSVAPNRPPFRCAPSSRSLSPAAAIFAGFLALVLLTGTLRAEGDPEQRVTENSGPFSEFSDDDWTRLGGYAESDASILAVTSDEAGNVYVGGSFSAIGSISANNIAMWNGQEWSAVGKGISGIDAVVHTLTFSDGTLYAGGEFSVAGTAEAANVAKWDGSTWSGLESGTDGPVFALAASPDGLYVGGQFTSAGGAPASNIALWNNDGWSALGSGVDAPWYRSDEYWHKKALVRALVFHRGILYVGGQFSSAGGISMDNIAQWSGSEWGTVGSGFNSDENGVHALAMNDGKLYVGYDWGVYAWDGFSWSRPGTVASRPAEPILAMAEFENKLYAGGIPDIFGGGQRAIWKWNGSEWTISSQTISRVASLHSNGTRLYAGLGEEENYWNDAEGDHGWLFELDGVDWRGRGRAFSMGTIQGLRTLDESLVVGGNFRRIYRPGVDHFGIYRDGEWVANSASGPVKNQGLFVSNNTLYALRKMYDSDGIRAWNGSSWSDTSPPHTRIAAIGGDSETLYSAQRVTLPIYPPSNASQRTQIYRLDGSGWTPVGNPANGEVDAIAVWEGDLYIGGTFTSMYEGVSANRIAMWNGNDWAPLESGIDGPVYTLVGSDKGLLVGGEFASAGGLDANHVALWDGNTWAAIGTGTDGPVFTLATAGDWLFAGGFFSSAGDSEANNIAVWDGERWSGLGSGTSGPVFALAPSGNRLYVGGKFFTVGGKPAGIFAMATFRQPSPPQLRLVRQPDSDEIILHIEGSPDSSIQIEATSDLSGSWTPIGTATEVSPGVYELSDPAATDLPRRFYRAVD